MFVIKSNLQLCGIANFVGIILLSWSQLDIFNASSAKKLQLNRPPQPSQHGSSTSICHQQDIWVFCSFLSI